MHSFSPSCCLSVCTRGELWLIFNDWFKKKKEKKGGLGLFPASRLHTGSVTYSHTHTHITVAESGTFTEKSLICTGAWPPTLHSPNHPLTAMHNSSELLQHTPSPPEQWKQHELSNTQFSCQENFKNFQHPIKRKEQKSTCSSPKITSYLQRGFNSISRPLLCVFIPPRDLSLQALPCPALACRSQEDHLQSTMRKSFWGFAFPLLFLMTKHRQEEQKKRKRKTEEWDSPYLTEQPLSP